MRRSFRHDAPIAYGRPASDISIDDARTRPAATESARRRGVRGRRRNACARGLRRRWRCCRCSTPAPAPRGNITFPPLHSFSESTSITVLGTAQVVPGQTPLKVNGVDASSAVGFAEWGVTVPLVPGRNELRLTTRDGAPLAEVVVERGADLVRPVGIALDADRDRVLVTDDVLHSVVAIDLTSGIRRVISDVRTPNAQEMLFHPFDIEMDPSGTRALVLQQGGIIPPRSPWIWPQANAVLHLRLCEGRRPRCFEGWSIWPSTPPATAPSWSTPSISMNLGSRQWTSPQVRFRCFRSQDSKRDRALHMYGGDRSRSRAQSCVGGRLWKDRRSRSCHGLSRTRGRCGHTARTASNRD